MHKDAREVQKQTIIQQPSSQSRGTICPIVQVLNKQTCKQMTKLATSFCVIIIIILCRSKQPKTLMYNVFHASANLRSGDVQLINFYIKSRCYQSKLPSPFDTFYQAIIWCGEIQVLVTTFNYTNTVLNSNGHCTNLSKLKISQPSMKQYSLFTKNVT